MKQNTVYLSLRYIYFLSFFKENKLKGDTNTKKEKTFYVCYM